MARPPEVKEPVKETPPAPAAEAPATAPTPAPIACQSDAIARVHFKDKKRKAAVVCGQHLKVLEAAGVLSLGEHIVSKADLANRAVKKIVPPCEAPSASA